MIYPSEQAFGTEKKKDMRLNKEFQLIIKHISILVPYYDIVSD